MKAARVAAALKTELAVDVSLVVGGMHEFTVWVDDTKVFDKAQGPFPEPKDVVAAVKTALPTSR